jgi:hypothetical protein
VSVLKFLLLTKHHGAEKGTDNGEIIDGGLKKIWCSDSSKNNDTLFTLKNQAKSPQVEKFCFCARSCVHHHFFRRSHQLRKKDPASTLGRTWSANRPRPVFDTQIQMRPLSPSISHYGGVLIGANGRDCVRV